MRRCPGCKQLFREGELHDCKAQAAEDLTPNELFRAGLRKWGEKLKVEGEGEMSPRDVADMVNALANHARSQGEKQRVADPTGFKEWLDGEVDVGREGQSPEALVSHDDDLPARTVAEEAPGPDPRDDDRPAGVLSFGGRPRGTPTR